MIVFYQCGACGWAAEMPSLPAACERCGSNKVRDVDAAEAAAMINRHDLVFCQACQRYETR